MHDMSTGTYADIENLLRPVVENLDSISQSLINININLNDIAAVLAERESDRAPDMRGVVALEKLAQYFAGSGDDDDD